MANIITDVNALDYNIPQDHAGQNFVESGSGYDADLSMDNLENHIHDDLGGTEGKAGTLTHVNFNDGEGILDGEFSGPERELLTDAGDNDVKHQVTDDHYTQKNPSMDVTGLAKKYAAVSGTFAKNDPINVMKAQGLADGADMVTASTISGLRTALILAGDTRWTSDAMLGRKDNHNKFVYVDYKNGNYSLKMQNVLRAGEAMTMPPKSVLKVKKTFGN